MSEKSVLIIGAGLGGLLCGKILSQEGCSVTILEQGGQAGGALQTFVRDGIRFDTGFHTVGGLGPGEPLEQVLRPLGLMGLPWIPMEPDELVGCSEPFLRLSAFTEEEREHVLAPFRMSVWRLKGGGKTLVDALSEGQDIRLHKQVTAVEDRTVTCVDGSRYTADIVISDIHPKQLLRLLRDHVRPAWRARIETRTDSPGIFSVNAKLRPGAIPHLNHSIFLWNELMVHFGERAADGTARSLDLMAFETPATDPASLAESLISKAAARLPGLPEAIERYWTSSAKTWEHFTGTPGGTAYGIRKRGPEDYLTPRTPLPWLFLTGQNIGLHGVLGTSVSAINTCNAIKDIL